MELLLFVLFFIAFCGMGIGGMLILYAIFYKGLK